MSHEKSNSKDKGVQLPSPLRVLKHHIRLTSNSIPRTDMKPTEPSQFCSL